MTYSLLRSTSYNDIIYISCRFAYILKVWHVKNSFAEIINRYIPIFAGWTIEVVSFHYYVNRNISLQIISAKFADNDMVLYVYQRRDL